MVAHKNFYETIQEAKMRLKNTIVRYKDNFYYVLEVSDHMGDGKFRIYMDELGHGKVGRDRHMEYPSYNEYDGSLQAKGLDTFVENNPDSGLIRKYADSRHFDKFRPFPLGNVNINGSVIYCERSPTRNMHQGLLLDAILSTNVESVPARFDPYASRARRSAGLLSQHGNPNNGPLGNASVDMLGPEFKAMLLGEYPSYRDVVYNLRDPAILNKGCAFHRDYSIMRGPVDTLLLCYKHSGVGIIDQGEELVIGSSHEYLKEELAELGVFNSIRIKEVLTDD